GSMSPADLSLGGLLPSIAHLRFTRHFGVYNAPVHGAKHFVNGFPGKE
ncbi:MAG: hypothetical protein HW380_3679, partial [Magnetococcales bacterium]|nr:hypothetical protein [Magnetococcales bacterium]